MRKRGFTLIELLVVIAIIAILAAILFPVFAKAREKARQSSCLSNVKQIALGLLQYTQDYDERFPLHNVGYLSTVYGDTPTPGAPDLNWRTSAPLAYQYTWVTCVYPYLKNSQILRCPSASTTTCLGCDYGMPNYGVDSNTTTTVAMFVGGGVGPSMGSFTRPAETLMLADKYAGNPQYLHMMSGGVTYYATSNRHNEGANAAFVDGHSKWYKTDYSAVPGFAAPYGADPKYSGHVPPQLFTNPFN
jgi:prepilin-type N-terminal cleavage/methylation domain-containing protein/prepilin-type processing-associated H-X9-DG protein